MLGRRFVPTPTGPRGIPDIVMPVVQQAQITHPEAVVRFQQVKLPAEGKAVFHAHEGYAPALAVNAAHVRGRERQANPVRMLQVRHAPDRRDLHERIRNGPRPVGRFAVTLRHEHDEERGVQPALLHPGQIHLLPRRPGSHRVVGRAPEIGRNVHVCVDGEHTRVDGLAPSRKVRLRRNCRGHEQQRERKRRAGQFDAERHRPGVQSCLCRGRSRHDRKPRAASAGDGDDSHPARPAASGTRRNPSQFTTAAVSANGSPIPPDAATGPGPRASANPARAERGPEPEGRTTGCA